MSEKTEKIVLNALGLTNINQVWNVPYHHEETDRNAVAIYQRNIRDVRLATGRFYTESEHRERIARINALQLP